MIEKLRTDKEWVVHILNNCRKDINGCFIYGNSVRYNKKNVTTSRLVYEGTIGVIPENMVVGKLCNNARCCNPDHLFIRGKGERSNLISDNKKFNVDIVEEIIKLRVQQKTIEEIGTILNISKSSVTKYLKGIPISEETLISLREQGRVKANNTVRVKRNLLWNEQFKFKDMIEDSRYSKEIKGNIAEAAILYRLLIHNYHVYSSIFSGNRIDMIAYNIGIDKFIKIQVKCLYKHNITPFIKNRRTKGHNEHVKYNKEDLDFLIGYDIINDTAYVFTFDELRDRKVISVTTESKENWDKIRTFCSV